MFRDRPRQGIPEVPFRDGVAGEVSLLPGEI